MSVKRVNFAGNRLKRCLVEELFHPRQMAVVGQVEEVGDYSTATGTQSTTDVAFQGQR